MNKNMRALSECRNDHIKLLIISARNPELLAGYERAWPEYFSAEAGVHPVSVTHILEIAMEWRATQDQRVMQSESATSVAYLEALRIVGIPVISVYLIGDEQYKKTGITATRGLLFQLGDFADVVPFKTIVGLYHTKWLVVDFRYPLPYSDRHNLEHWVRLVPLACVHLDA